MDQQLWQLTSCVSNERSPAASQPERGHEGVPFVSSYMYDERVQKQREVPEAAATWSLFKTCSKSV